MGTVTKLSDYSKNLEVSFTPTSDHQWVDIIVEDNEMLASVRVTPQKIYELVGQALMAAARCDGTLTEAEYSAILPTVP